MNRGASGAWLALSLVLALGSAVAWFVPAGAIDWQPGLARTQAWRLFTAAWVHRSPLHVLVNLAGLALVAALGHALRLPSRAAIAWWIAWPLTHAALLWQPALLHYGGLSGVLHAGVGVCIAWACRDDKTATRRIGWALLAGLSLKIALEAPWAGAVRWSAELDVPVAPLAHAAGAAFGLLAGALARMGRPGR